MITNAEKLSAYDKLTLKQKIFVDEYILSGNGTASARKAGYALNSCNEQASQNLTKLTIKEAIRERLEIIQPKNWMTPERLRERANQILNRDGLRPEVEIKALEVAGKMTPGTFAGDMVQQGPRVTFNTLHLELPSPVAEIPAPPTIRVSTPSTIIDATPVMPTAAPDGMPTPAGSDATPPPAPSMCSNMDTPKNLQQIDEATTYEVKEDQHAGDN